MKLLKYLFVLSLSLLISSCDEREVEVFGTEHELYFKKFFVNAVYPGTDQADSTAVSFFFSTDDITFITADLVMHLSGRRLTEDLNFKLRVVPEETTAIASEYDISGSFTFRAKDLSPDDKDITDTIHVKMLRSSRLKDFPDGVKLVVEVIPNEKVGIGQFERSRAKIILTERSVRPTWWTREVEEYLMGTFSEKKYLLFLRNVDNAISMNESMIENEPDRAIKLAREFKLWLYKQNPQVLEEDGRVMTVNV